MNMLRYQQGIVWDTWPAIRQSSEPAVNDHPELASESNATLTAAPVTPKSAGVKKIVHTMRILQTSDGTKESRANKLALTINKYEANQVAEYSLNKFKPHTPIRDEVPAQNAIVKRNRFNRLRALSWDSFSRWASLSSTS